MYNFNPTYNGIEIDMLSLGDADAILVTAWAGTNVWRVLIDGGTGAMRRWFVNFLE